jgi:anti-anti-sigma regulatory factor
MHPCLQKELTVPVTVEGKENYSQVRLEGVIDIESAAEMKDILINALASNKEIRLMLDGAIELDITALQLLYAAERSAAKMGIPLTLEGSVPDDIGTAMTDAGLPKFEFQQ